MSEPREWEKPVPITSEMVEPFAAMFVGRMWARAEAAKKIGRTEHYDALNHLWFGLHGLERIAIAISTATHFSIAMNNHITGIARMIQAEIGIDPMKEPGWKWS
jgi:hypothetical protein